MACLICPTCPQCGECHRTRANGVSVAVYKHDGAGKREYLGIFEADVRGCACGAYLVGFARRPTVPASSPVLQEHVDAAEYEHPACAYCARRPMDENDGVYCGAECRQEDRAAEAA